MNDAILRDAYLMANDAWEAIRKKLSDARALVHDLEKQEKPFRNIVAELGHVVCPECKGCGWFWAAFTQDDTKRVECNLCEGTGLRQPVHK